MTITVVTTCNKAGLESYGRRFVETFEQRWPHSPRLVVYAEGWSEPFPRAEVYDLLVDSYWLSEFKSRHRDNPAAHGLKRGHYEWPLDAVRFAHKVAAIIAADKLSVSDHLLWLDADTITHSPVTLDDIATWLPDPAWLSWLERDVKCGGIPECGFLLFNRRHDRHAEAMSAMHALYAEDRLFQFDQTHDSFVWRFLVSSLALPTRSLSGKGSATSHVFANSPISKHMDHLKGVRRKKMGRTPREERRLLKDDTTYWR